MLSLEVLQTVFLLKEIRNGLSSVSIPQMESELLSVTRKKQLLGKLREAGLVHFKKMHKMHSADVSCTSSYELSHPIHEISLCDVMTAIGGGIELNLKDSEPIYNRYRVKGKPLQAMHHMMCLYLSEVRLTDL